RSCRCGSAPAWPCLSTWKRATAPPVTSCACARRHWWRHESRPGEFVPQESLHIVPQVGGLLKIDLHLLRLAPCFQRGWQPRLEAVVQRKLMSPALGQLLLDLGREQVADPLAPAV